MVKDFPDVNWKRRFSTLVTRSSRWRGCSPCIQYSSYTSLTMDLLSHLIRRQFLYATRLSVPHTNPKWKHVCLSAVRCYLRVLSTPFHIHSYPPNSETKSSNRRNVYVPCHDDNNPSTSWLILDLLLSLLTYTLRSSWFTKVGFFYCSSKNLLIWDRHFSTAEGKFQWKFYNFCMIYE
jgi:hypothetical protein